MLNKIDLPAADPDLHGRAVADLVGEDPDRVLRISAKTGEGVDEVLEAIVERVPPPAGDPAAPARALIFDSVYDQYRGVVAFARVVDGAFAAAATAARDADRPGRRGRGDRRDGAGHDADRPARGGGDRATS